MDLLKNKTFLLLFFIDAILWKVFRSKVTTETTVSAMAMVIVFQDGGYAWVVLINYKDLYLKIFQ